MKEYYIDEPAKWKTRELSQIHIYSWSSHYGHKVVPVHYTGILGTGATFCPYRLDQRYVFGAVPSSSILRAHLYTTPSSMVGIRKLSLMEQVNFDPVIFLRSMLYEV